MRRLRRVLKWIGVGLGVIVLLAIAAIATITSTQWGSRLVIEKAIASYDEKIPGHVRIGRVTGRLATGLTLEDVMLQTGDGRPLVAIGRVDATLRWRGVLRAAVVLDTLHATDVQIHLWPDPLAWKHLSDPTKPPPAPGTPPGPDLPVSVQAQVIVSGLSVWQHGAKGTRALVRDAELHAALTAEGRDAVLTIDALSGHAMDDAVTLAAARGTLRWSSPVVDVEDLALVSSVALVDELNATIDVTHQTADGSVHGVGFVPSKDRPPLPVDLRARFTASRQAARVATEITAVGYAQVALDAGATLGPSKTVLVHGSGYAYPPTASAPRRPVAVVGGGRWDDRDGAVAAALVSRDLVLVADARRKDGDTAATVHAALSGGHVDADVQLVDDQPRRAEIDVSIASLRRVRTALAGLVPVDLPAMGGALTATGACARDGAVWTCQADAAGQQLEIDTHRIDGWQLRGNARITDGPPRGSAMLVADGIMIGGKQAIDAASISVSGSTTDLDVEAAARRAKDRVELAAHVHRTRTIDIGLERLRARVQKATIDLRRPSRITIAKQQIDVHDLALDVAGGNLHLDGRLALDGVSDLRVTAKNLDTGVLSRLSTEPSFICRLDAEVTLTGDASDPLLDARFALRKAKWRGETIGSGTLLASTDPTHARAQLSWKRGSERARIFAQLPVDLDLRTRKVELRHDGDAALGIDVHAFELKSLRAWMPDPRLAGRADLTLRAAGTLDAPTLAVSATASHLDVEDVEIGNASLLGAWDEGRVDAVFTLVGRPVETARVAVSLPLTIDARRGRIAMPERAPHRIAAQLSNVQLEALGPLLRRKLEGRVQAELVARAEHGEVTATANVLGSDLAFDGREVGAAQLNASLDAEGVSGHLLVSGNRARLVEARFALPLEVAPRGAVTMRDDAKLAAWMELRDVDLGIVAPLAGEGSLTGDTAGFVAVGGTMTQPEIDVDLVVQRMSMRGSRLGRVRMRSQYDGSFLHAKLRQSRGRETIDLRARVPLDLDLAHRRVGLREGEPYRVRLAADGVTREVLQPFFDLPPMWDLDLSARLEAHGTPAELYADAQVRASFRTGDRPATPLAARVQIEPDSQRLLAVLGADGPGGLRIKARVDAPLAAVVAGKLDKDDVYVRAQLDADGFPLRDLAPFAPMQIHDPVGKLHAHARIDGPLTGPQMRGRLAIQDGALTVVQLNQRFREVQLVAVFEGHDVRLQTLQMRSGDGWAQGEGRLHVERGETRGEMRLVAHRMPVVRPGLPLMRLNAGLRTRIDATGKLTEIDVRMRDGFLDVLDTKLVARPQQIPQTDGVTYTDARGRRIAKRKDKKSREPWMPRDMHLTFALDEPLRVRGTSADMSWVGEVEVFREPDAPPRAIGSFRIESGRVVLAGNDMDIQRGEIRLPDEGDLDPFVDVVATTDVADHEVTMTVRGRASRPELRLSSSPPLPEDQVFALLVTGRADAARDEEDSDYATKAASVLAAFQNPALQRALRDRVGIDRVGVGFGDTVEQPIVTVGKRFTRKLYVETGYHHNAPEDENEAEVRLEYMFRPPGWSVETFFGDAAQGGIGVWWRRRFGAPKAPDAPKRRDRATAPRDRPTTRRRGRRSRGCDASFRF